MTTHIKILALDTVFEQCSVALLDNQTVIGEITIAGNRGQTETILPMIDDLLATHKKLSPIHQRMRVSF